MMENDLHFIRNVSEYLKDTLEYTSRKFQLTRQELEDTTQLMKDQHNARKELKTSSIFENDSKTVNHKTRSESIDENAKDTEYSVGAHVSK